MERFKTWRAGLVACVALVVFALAPAVSSQSSTPVDHGVHHASTPTSGSVCVGMATPSSDAAMSMGTPGMGNMDMMGTPGMGNMDMMGTPGMGDMGMMMDPEQFDLMFIDMMIQHHKGAVAMARVALERGEHPEIIQLAEDIISAQEQEITQLATWRDAWYPDAPAMTMDQMMGGVDMMGMMQGMGDMDMMDPETQAANMCAASEPFDLAFINAMIPHHQSAIMMAEAAAQRSTHPEVRELSQEIIDAQTREIEQMEGWSVAWYGEATPSDS